MEPHTPLPVAPALADSRGDDHPATPSSPRRLTIGISPHSVETETVLSTDEIELLHRKFALFNPNVNKTRSLSASHAKKLFRDDFPSMSEWEVQELFEKCDLNGDGLLSLSEYLQTRAYHRLVVEAANELEVVRSFTILDTDSDGILVAIDVLTLVEQAKEPSARLLKQVIQEAVAATEVAATERERRSRRSQRTREQEAPKQHSRKGEITLDAFVATIRGENRKVEQEVAAKTLRLLSLDEKLQELQSTLQDPSQSLSVLHRANLTAKLQTTRIEVDVLKNEVTRMKKELLTDTSQTNALTKICETLVATYENEQHVYECLRNLITYCGLEDPVLFRYNLEQSGREVHVLDSLLMTPPTHVKKSPEYAEMMELAIHQPPSGHENPPPSPNNSGLVPGWGDDSGAHSYREDARFDHLKLNSTLRKQFVFYAMLGDVTNLESMTRSNFFKFVKDCDLHTLPSPPLTDPDIGSVYARATGSQPHVAELDTPRMSPRSPRYSSLSPRGTRTAGMTFAQWLLACELIFSRTISEETLDADHLEDLMKTHVVAKANCIPAQNIAPDISQDHVLKLMREYMWRLRQIFVHFGARSLSDVDTNFTLDMKTFLRFARAFKIIRESAERDGEPFTPPPLSGSNIIQPISLMELIREFYAAKLDISFSNRARRDALDLNFREFLRCLQRIALAMHAHNPAANAKRNTGSSQTNGLLTTSFEAIKEDEEREPIHAQTPLYNRRGNLFGKSTSPSKNCKMTSTSIISQLLHTSRAMAAGTLASSDEHETTYPQKPQYRARSPTKVFYGGSVTASAVPFIPLSSQCVGDDNNRRSLTSPRLQPSSTPTATGPNHEMVSQTSTRTPHSPRTPRRHRPILCGGPPVVRIIQQPPGK